MISIKTDNAADVILDILRRSRAVRTNIQNKESTKALDTGEICTDFSYSPGASLKYSENEKSTITPKNEHQKDHFKKDDAYTKTKNMIEGILNRMTAQDYQKLYEEGFKPEDLTIEALSEAIQVIKEYFEGAALKDTDAYSTNEHSKNTNIMNELSGNTGVISENEIIRRMEAENLPVNKDSVDRIMRALKISEDIPRLEKKDILYLLNKGLAPSIENLYKARYSSQNGEMSVKLTDGEWEALIPQVCEIIGDTAETSGKELFEDAKWLIENNVPLTKENIKLISDVKDLIKSYSPDLVLDRIFKGMKEGILPKDAVLIEKDELSINETSQGDNIAAVKSINIKQLLEDIHGITEDDIIRTVNTYDDITIRNLTDSREGDETDVQSVENADKEKQVKFLTAKRQIEEIRLKMTLEAAIRLEKKGFYIETETLERVVERLRTEEENYYKELYSQTVSESDEPDEASLKLLQLTSETVYKLKLMPAYVLGATLNDRKDRTMPDLLAAGQSIKTELDKANEAYEALFTIPRAEYGDSIRKAFSNMYSLMEEMGIENTEYNQRAIRILGYNRMVITHENIEKVKAYDLSVNYLLQNLNPKVAVQIIKLGVNPLDIPIDELNRHIDMLKEQGYSTLDKYSAYLYKLEREEGLSDDERKAYIGIYRLLYQIEKSDGAALGAVIKSNQNITLNHLLTALRTSKKGSVNYKIDDGFGALQEISFSKESITDQLGAVFNNSSKDMTSDTDISLVDSSAQEEIQNVIIKELLNSLTPGKLHQLYIDIQNMAVNSDGKEAADLNVWKTIGNMSLEQLLDNLKNIQTDSDEEHAYYDEKIRMLQEVLNNSDRSIHFLNTFNMPCTAANLMIAGHIINNNTTAFKKLFGLIQDKEEEEKEKSQNGLKKKLELSDTLIDSMTMTKTYEQLEQEVKAVIEEEAVKDNVNLDDLAQLKLMGMHFNFLKNLARREFYQIPIETSGKITNVNLTIIRGKSTSGRVTVSLTSERLGSIKAEASLKGNKLSGYIVSDYAGSLKILENQTAPLISAAQEEGITISQMNFCLMQEADAVYLHQKPWDTEEEKNPETERILYKVAKAMIHMIRSAEESVGAVA